MLLDWGDALRLAAESSAAATAAAAAAGAATGAGGYMSPDECWAGAYTRPLLSST